jgi:hypothetical protein
MREYAIEIISILVLSIVVLSVTKALNFFDKKYQFLHKERVIKPSALNDIDETKTLHVARSSSTLVGGRKKLAIGAGILLAIVIGYLYYQNQQKKEWGCLQIIEYRVEYYRLNLPEGKKIFKTQNEAIEYCLIAQAHDTPLDLQVPASTIEYQQGE